MEVQATPTIRLICALVILLPSVVGLILQVIVLVAIRLGWKMMWTNSFYIMMLQITISNFIALFTDLYIAFPITLTGVQYMGDSLVLYHIPLFLEGFAFRVLLFFSFFLAVNRMAIFLFPKINIHLFSVKGTIILSLFGWTYSATILILNDVFGCEKIFSKDEFYFGYICTNRVPGKFQFADTIPLSILLCIEVLTFTFLPKLNVTGHARFFITSIITLSIIANNLAPPIILLMYNKDIRRYARQAFCCKGAGTTPGNTTSRHETLKALFTTAKPTRNITTK
ncbi:hypothetical protein ANCCAN_01442 [Ancylostoma caninum]|uniref:7TM GPCR serpentine receptor class x (Srx) domain-containing protein n=1 Tax=Ancylostoma caninum TaxID=29170 RepID=A0A368H9U1_ANCCA|nr:hypothetical protein ANCCAN_01442 [Ancylostoma caninum]